MDRTMLFWTLALFFGASIGFGTIQRWTEGEGFAVTFLAQLALLVVLVVGIVVVVKYRDRSGGGDPE